MIDASAGRALMNKTLEEVWELIESVEDNHHCFKTRATSTTRGVYEIAPSESTVLSKSLADIASMLRELKENQQATPKLLTQPSHSFQPPQVPAKHCGICSCNSHYTDECPQLQEDNAIACSHNYYDQPPSTRQYQQQSQGWHDNQQGR
ncbi:hypothetical protein PIB30_096092 [Stylosanthes scabra]|uniref:Uncharacterized protein n=1 Tax=Stylosanthes scabra TaxID=79078 RepID=A0ABU6SWD3_9FABA|nr:hypothetical protein [Stylosanthes scabra]